MEDVEVSGKNAQAQGKLFWQEHYKLMSSTIPEVVDTNMFDRPHQRRPQTVHMSYSDIARSSVNLLPLPHPPMRARTDIRTHGRTQAPREPPN
jgi:hypothetical protein